MSTIDTQDDTEHWIPDRIFSVVRLVRSEKGIVAEHWHTAIERPYRACPTYLN